LPKSEFVGFGWRGFCEAPDFFGNRTTRVSQKRVGSRKSDAGNSRGGMSGSMRSDRELIPPATFAANDSGVLSGAALTF
jgi:hypothetical protein